MESRCGSGAAGLVGADEGPMRGDSNLDNPALIGNKLLAHSLVGWAANLGLRLEVFSLGPAAALIGAHPNNPLVFGMCTLDVFKTFLAETSLGVS
jgi:hypothetical protein